MLDDLKRLYATTKNEDLVDILGVSQRTVIRKARELGLQKDPEWQHGNTMRHLKMMQFENKVHGIKSPFKKGMHYSPDNEFKPGHQESPEVKAIRIERVKEYYRKHPFAARERGIKASETRKAKISKIDNIITRMAEEVNDGVDIERVVDKYIYFCRGTRTFRQDLIYGIKYMVNMKGHREMNVIFEKNESEKVREAKIRKLKTELLKMEGKIFKL